MKTMVLSKGRVTLPAKLRQRDGIEPGQELEVKRLNRGQYLLTRQEPRANEGLVDWLLSCPVRGFFTPIASESTNHL